MSGFDVGSVREMVLDNMRMAKVLSGSSSRVDPTTRRGVRDAVKDIGNKTDRPAAKILQNREKLAFYIGQLYVLDMIAEMQDSYTATADSPEVK